MDDDVFDQSEEAEKRDLQRQFDRYTSGFFKAGFRQALEVDNEEILQEAFDEGYAFGFRMAVEFNTVRFTTKIIEGMYKENKRLPASCQEAPLLKLKSFNSKVDELQSQIQQASDAMQCFNQLVNIDDLKTEAKTILCDLECPVTVPW